MYTFYISYYMSITVQSSLCQYNNEDIIKILNTVYLHKIFNVKTEVDLLEPLKQEYPHQAELLVISVGEAQKNL